MSFEYVETDHPQWKYQLTQDYLHLYVPENQPRLGQTDPQSTRKYACLEETCLLRERYAWNGSNVVADTEDSQRASAVHDASCQAMGLDIYEASWKNWERAASEYRQACIEDGLERINSDGKGWVRIRAGGVRSRAWTRYSGILVGGGNEYKWRKWAMKFA
ncbi:MAG: hypothetical protein O7B25_08225 [Gammaproteobacteria bacterium]|nr:hypothetical protein [Gammaproteobacteria bacterium]